MTANNQIPGANPRSGRGGRMLHRCSNAVVALVVPQQRLLRFVTSGKRCNGVDPSVTLPREPRTSHRMRSVVLASIMAGCTSLLSASQNNPPLLELVEDTYDVLPAGFIPTGMLAGPNARVIIWSGPLQETLIRFGSAWMRMDVHSPVVGACFFEGGRSAVVDDAGTVSSFDEHGILLSRSRLFSADSLVSATCSGLDWFVLTRTGALYGGTGPSLTTRHILRESWPELHGTRPTEIFLAGAEDGQLLLTSSTPPFSAVRFHPTENRVTTFSPLIDSDFPAELSKGEGMWRSLGTIPLAAAYLRTLFDARSDDRLLLLYDPCGNLLRATAVRAPIGLVAAANEHIFAVRQTRRVELVQYRWHLRRPITEDSCN